jgi:hypothetical protein
MVRAHPCHSLRRFRDSVNGSQSPYGTTKTLSRHGFHVGRFVTAVIDTEADRENIKALYSSLKTISDQIDVSARQLTLLHSPDMDLTLSLRRHW